MPSTVFLIYGIDRSHNNNANLINLAWVTSAALGRDNSFLKSGMHKQEAWKWLMSPWDKEGLGGNLEKGMWITPGQDTNNLDKGYPWVLFSPWHKGHHLEVGVLAVFVAGWTFLVTPKTGNLYNQDRDFAEGGERGENKWSFLPRAKQ